MSSSRIGSGWRMPRRPSGYFSLSPTHVLPGQRANSPVPCFLKNADTSDTPSRLSIALDRRGSLNALPSVGSQTGRRAAVCPLIPARSHKSRNIAGSIAVSRPSASKSFAIALVRLYGRTSIRAQSNAAGLSSNNTASSASRAKPPRPCAAASSHAS